MKVEAFSTQSSNIKYRFGIVSETSLAIDKPALFTFLYDANAPVSPSDAQTHMQTYKHIKHTYEHTNITEIIRV